MSEETIVYDLGNGEAIDYETEIRSDGTLWTVSACVLHLGYYERYAEENNYVIKKASGFEKMLAVIQETETYEEPALSRDLYQKILATAKEILDSENKE